MAATAKVGTGSTITFSGFSYKVIDWDGPNIEAKAINASNMSTSTWEEYITGSLKDPGEITARCEYDGTFPDVGGTTQTISVASNGNTRTGKAFIRSIKPSVPLEEKMTMEVVFRCSGAWS